MSNWNQDIYAKAWNYATRAHHGQTYGGPNEGETIDYINHIASVAMEVMWALQFDPDANGDLAIQCALLHDTIEDTASTFASIEQHFGRQVANGVLALSKNPDLPKAEQLADSLTRIGEQGREIGMVKMADRITNLYHPPFYWQNEKILSYQAEAHTILTALAPANQHLAQRLQQKIQDYPQFLRPAK